MTKPSESLIRALRRQFRPLVKLFLANDLTFPLLVDMLKGIYVEVAEEASIHSGEHLSDSRIHFMTGIHRKDVKRLRNRVPENSEMPETVSLSTQLVARWIGRPEYLNENGTPLPLPRLIKQGGEISFESLVITINKDIRPRAILDEWLSKGIVHLDNQDRVCLNTSVFFPKKGYDEKAYFLGENLHDHIAAAAHNLMEGQPPFFERAVFYDQLGSNSVEELRGLVNDVGMKALNRINKQSMKLQEADRAAGENPKRIRFGIYFYSTSENPKNQDEQTEN